MKSFLVIMLLINSLPLAFAAPEDVVVRCEGKYQGVKEVLTVKIGSNGKIKEWKKNQMALVENGAIYAAAFSEDIEEYGYEWIKSFRATNGAAILELGTTADSFKLAISSDRKTANLQCSDFGSGAADHQFNLSCKVVL
jgi:hypothetical protein